MEISENAFGNNRCTCRLSAFSERLYGQQHYEVAINLNNFGGLHQAKGDADKAEQLFRRALSIKVQAARTEPSGCGNDPK